ncbi:conserved protein of unknown function [Enterobacter cancerogenus]|nr:conserved protein of unknown function [Enterobacter cancerogenus]
MVHSSFSVPSLPDDFPHNPNSFDALHPHNSIDISSTGARRGRNKFKFPHQSFWRAKTR